MTSPIADQHYPINLDQLPKGWVVTSLGEAISDVQPGFASGIHNQEGKGVPHLRPMNIDREGRLDLSIVKFVPPNNPLRVATGDILFNNTNSAELVGKTTCIDRGGEWAFSNHMTRLRPPAGISGKFIAYQLHYLWMAGYFLHRCTHHVNQASVASKTLAQTVPVVLAPASEQMRIAAEIEKQFTRLDASVAALKRVQGNLRRYRASVLKAACEGRLVPTEAELARAEGRPYEPADRLLARILIERRARWEADQVARMEAVGKPPKDDKWKARYREPTGPDAAGRFDLLEGWTWATVGQVSEVVQYGTSSKMNEESSGVPVLRMGNLVDGRLSFDDIRFLPADHPEFPGLLLRPGDILFNRTNSPELVGKTAVYRGTPTPCSFASYLIRVRTVGACSPDMIAYYMNSTFGRAWIASVVSQQVGQANVNGTKLQALTIPLAPSLEQKRIVAEVEERLSFVTTLEVAVRASLKRAERLRQAILKRAFSGDLVSQDPGDEPAGALLERIRTERANGQGAPIGRAAMRRGHRSMSMRGSP